MFYLSIIARKQRKVTPLLGWYYPHYFDNFAMNIFKFVHVMSCAVVYGILSKYGSAVKRQSRGHLIDSNMHHLKARALKLSVFAF